MNTALPTVAQLHEARLKRWHQTGEALLTAENLRSWINASGLVLFAPRTQIVAPAPTFVEAVLGAPTAEPTLHSVADARGLLARLVDEGVGLPLNLMGAHGTTGDTPDFVVSAAVFSYIFTLRGDKAWKQPPSTSGPVKVSNLALATFHAISSNGPMTAYDLATQLGKEVTEAACLRALNELWIHLRVIPLLQQDDRPTAWELTSTRFSKQIKAGANAGLPSAVSALISLYLGQVMVATEDEIESFLSPLAPRSRIREVAHALLNARQLNTVVIEGKTLLHVAGEAPAFAVPQEQAFESDANPQIAAEEEEGEGSSRIKKYVARPRKIGTGYLGKGKPAAGKRPSDRGSERSGPDRRGTQQGFKPRGGPRDERERRSFRKPVDGAPERRFDRPWDEERPRRRPAEPGGFRPPQKGRLSGEQQGAEGSEFRRSSRPPRRDEGRPERRPRRQDEADFKRHPRRQNEAGFERRPRRDEGTAGDRPYQRRPRPDRDENARGPREAAGAERPKFHRFDDANRNRRRDDSRPDRRGAGSADRRGSGTDRRGPRPDFERRPGRREASRENRPARGEGGFEQRPRSAKPGGARPFGGGKPAGGRGQFKKSSGVKKPFPKKPSGRTPRPRRDESA